MQNVTDRPSTETPATATGTPTAQTQTATPARAPQRDLTQGNIPWTLFSLAWPQTVAGSLQTLDQLMDLVWAGFISSTAIASIGVAQGWNQLLMTGRMGLDTATRAMISRAIGAKDNELADHIAQQSIIFGMGLMMVLSTLAVIFTESLLRILGVSDELIAQGSNYVRLQFVATLTNSLVQTSTAILQASGDTITPMKAQMLARLVNVTVSPTLIFFFGFGLQGAAMANIVAQLVASVVTYRKLLRGDARIHLTFKNLKLDLPLAWKMIRLGAPASTTNMERAVANLIFVGLVAPFGNATVAAYTISQRVQQFVNMGSMGWGIGSGVLTGQALGAGNPGRAKKAVFWALGYTLLANSIIGGLVLIFPDYFLKIFSRDAALLAVAIPWLQIQVFGFMFMGNNMVFQQVYNHAGDTFVPMIVTFGSMWFIEIPLAVMLSGLGDNWSILGISFSLPTIIDLGQFGVAWAIVIALFARLLVYFPYLIWGPWWKKKVF